MMNKLQALYLRMIEYYAGDPKRIQHFIKVHGLSRLIGLREQLPPEELFILEAAALVHDIGIKVSESRYGKCSGKLQEQEGPPVAMEMLTDLGFEKYIIERVCYLVGHHHTYEHIDFKDYRILIEADFLVNLYEDNASENAIKAAYDKVFETETGKKICRDMFSYAF